jgi:hypothetical protein
MTDLKQLQFHRQCADCGRFVTKHTGPHPGATPAERAEKPHAVHFKCPVHGHVKHHKDPGLGPKYHTTVAVTNA